ncbi:enoyl-CoA hydratase/isomerase family protein [Desulfallas sp. Bu1-1]|uniref:enoyl-CoA hydratase/isomerase family protein n=1 Tax=Desulfallas sp. Bu1-1 TaxID=2787620 RepID=UPI00189FCA8F|nr:enoyl-CoA hydratase-related protein [Desulfallas sp. Bu1-1]MBF7082856.1 enoyl-CoA hydratase/isomerase family protein [Desulfallas sp. Bu1-1]
MTTGQFVKITRENNTAVITIDNPPVNALSHQIIDELDRILDELVGETDVRSVIITGAGEKAFVAGADIRQFPYLTKEKGYDLARTGQLVFNKIEALNVPVIAAINGFCLGGGCELAMACDIRIAGENAKLGQPEVNLGIIPGYGGTQRLPRLVGAGKAKELIFTGEAIDAREAYRIGLVDILVPPGEALKRALALCAKIQEKGPLAISAAKKAVNRGLDQTLDDGLELEAVLFKELCATEDQKEGARAFLAKEKPRFQGK